MDEQVVADSSGGASSPVQEVHKKNNKVKITWPFYVLFAFVAGLVGAILAWGFLSDSLAALGIPDPGPVTSAGLPFLRAVGWIVAALSVGSFLATTFFISPREVKQSAEDGILKSSYLNRAYLSVDGLIAARTGAFAALCFGLIAIVMIPLVMSDLSGQPFAEALKPHNWAIAFEQVALAKAWAWVAFFAFLTGLAGLFFRNWLSQPLLFVASIVMTVPLALEGHSAAGGDHDYGTNSLLWHLVLMLVWVGGLMALIAHARRIGPNMDLAVKRYSIVATYAVIGMAISGIVNALLRMEFSDLFTSNYGLLVLAKAVGVVVVGMFGLAHRTLTIPKLEKNPKDAALFTRVAIVEVLAMAAVTGIAISMGRTPPPAPQMQDLSVMALEMGYSLEKEPTLFSVFTMWRFDLMLGTIGILLLAFYVCGLVALRRQAKKWNHLRTFWWILGCITLVVTVSSGIGMNMPATFSMHMVAHMLLSMVVPVFLVLGAPLTLIMESVKPGEPGRPGLHEWAAVLADNPLLRFLLHPAVNTIQFIIIFYALYLTPLYELMVSEHAGHLIMNFVFVISGYLYYWEMIGPDPKPEERTHVSRLAWLTFSMPFHLFFGVYLMQLQVILAEEFYSRLNLPWEVDLAYDQLVGGGIAWASGSFPLIIVFGYLFRGWFREERIVEKNYEARAAATNFADAEEYNQMLTRMNNGHDPHGDYYQETFEPKDKE
ncbi:cytochrome c oxidase assembly protein [Corynebacterium crudilactis]|uniref:Copper resistance protein n=1 Tax=Corynebacterium crudilactis TaxID=1652495 RepID=A0A172QVF3_9CORY|nr:cytochrome c oxidase assembly protein [Corynebacterium crudilactis]ANE04687.1 copper resistance protein [Corynebacterium crudilactis]